MAKKDAAAPEKKEGRLKQIALVYKMTKKTDPRIGLILLGVFLVTTAIAYGVFYLVPGPWFLDLTTSILIGLLSVLIVFGRRAQKSQYAQIEGQTGAAAAVLGQLKRGWKVEPGIAFNKNQDLVHRVVGPPGIVLVGEGNPHRLKSLMANERRKHERVASETPIFEVVSGDVRRRGPRAQADPLRHQARPQHQARRDDRRAPAPPRPRRQPLRDADPQGTGADQHEGRPRQHARPLTLRRTARWSRCPSAQREGLETMPSGRSP